MTLDSMDGLLQPFVDGELTDEERKAVASYLERNPAAREVVKEQQAVKAALRSIQTDRAPNALRKKVLAELDALDAESDKVVRPKHFAGIWSRMGALAKGGLLMAPAAAAAVALFVVAQQSDSPLAERLAHPVGAEHMDGGVQLKLGNAGSNPVKVAPIARSFDPSLGRFPLQIAHRPSLPENVELVSDHAANAMTSQATVQYEDRRAGIRVLDRQLPASSDGIHGTLTTLNGQNYYFSRTDRGQAVVEFDHEGVRHELSLAGDAPTPAGRSLDAQEPDFQLLLGVADALRRR